MAGMWRTLSRGWARISARWSPSLLGFVVCELAHAESCHAPPRSSASELRLDQLTAAFTTPQFQGHYQGLSLSGSVAVTALAPGEALPAPTLDANLAVYRAEYNGRVTRGFGDLRTRVSWPFTFSQSSEKTPSLGGGVWLGAEWPTGESTQHLGMGHAMLIPGAWFTWRTPEHLLRVHAAWAKSLGSATHRHQTNLVAPMSASEVAWGLRLERELWLGAVLGAAVEGAEPLATGTARTSGCMLLGLRGTRWSPEVETCWPLRGDAFDWRLRTGVAFNW
jgi:hypothetical protein